MIKIGTETLNNRGSAEYNGTTLDNIIFNGTMVYSRDFGAVVTQNPQYTLKTVDLTNHKSTWTISNVSVMLTQPSPGHGVEEFVVLYPVLENGCVVLPHPGGSTLYDVYNISVETIETTLSSKYIDANTPVGTVISWTGAYLNFDVPIPDTPTYSTVDPPQTNLGVTATYVSINRAANDQGVLDWSTPTPRGALWVAGGPVYL